MSTAFSKQKLKQSRDFIQAKRWEDALTAADDVLQFEKENYNALVFRALALLNVERREEAENVYITATKLQPRQVLAWQGLEKYYTESKQWGALAEVLRKQMDVALEASQATKCAEKLQSLIKLHRKEGSLSDIVSTLSLLLSDSPFYSLLCTLDPPDQTAPNKTSTYETQLNIYVRSLELLSEIVQRTEELEAAAIANELKKRRLRIQGASKSKKAMNNEVGVEVWSVSRLPALYQQIISHPHTSDELRHETEGKLLRQRHNLLVALPDPATSSPGPTGSAATAVDLQAAAKERSEAIARKEALRDEVLSIARGLVIIQVPDELAWSIYLETQDCASLVDLPFEQLRAFVHLLPRAGLAPSVRALLILLKDQLYLDAEVDMAKQLDVDNGDVPDPLTLALDGLDAAPASSLSQLIAATFYLLDEDYQSANNVADTCLASIKRIEHEMAIELTDTRVAVEKIMACALARSHPPQHHARAQRHADSVLTERTRDVDTLLIKAFVLETAQRWTDARNLYKLASESASTQESGRRADALRILSVYKTPRIQAGIGMAWCDVSSGHLQKGMEAIERVITSMDNIAAVNVEEKAQAWWRLGQSKWLAGGAQQTDTSHAYTCFITSIKQCPTYAPAFTSLGLFYESAAEPPDQIRAAKCFQRAFELDAREYVAARKLAEGFANDREWDLVDVVARRTVSGEGGDSILHAIPGAGKAHVTRNSWAWKAIGAVELHRHKYEISIRAFQTAIRADPDDATSWQQLGEAYAASGRHVAALKTFARALELASGDWTIRYSIAEVQRQLGDYQASIDAFTEILNGTDELSVQIALAETQLLLGEQEMATGYVRRAGVSIHIALKSALTALEKDARLRTAWKVVADGCFRLSRSSSSHSDDTFRTVAALLAIAKGQDVDNKLPSLHVVKISTVERLEVIGSDLHTAHNLLLYAVSFYKLCVVFNAADDHAAGSAWADLAIALYHLALPPTGLGQSRTDEEVETARLASRQAIGCLREALRHEPGNEDFWLALGNLTFELSPTLAQHSFIRAIENAPASPVPWSSLGVLYLQNEDFELANQAFITAQTLDPDQPEAWVGQAFVARRHGDHKAAQTLFEHAFQLCEGSVLEAGYGFAAEIFALFSTNPPPPQIYSAAFALASYIALAPQDSDGLHLGALFAERQGSMALATERVDRAASLLEAAYERTERPDLAEKYAIAKCNAGRLHLATGDYEEAIGCYEATLSLIEAALPDDQEIQMEETGTILSSTLKRDLRRTAHIGTALAQYYLGELDASITAFEAALEELRLVADREGDQSRTRAQVEVLLAAVCWAIDDSELRQQAASRLTESLAEVNLASSATTLGAIALLTSDDTLLEAVMEQLDALGPSQVGVNDPQGDVAFLRHMIAVREGDTTRALGILAEAAGNSQSTNDAQAHAGAVLRTAVSASILCSDAVGDDEGSNMTSQARHATSEAYRVTKERLSIEGRGKLASAQRARAIALLLGPSHVDGEATSVARSTGVEEGQTTDASTQPSPSKSAPSAADDSRLLALEALRVEGNDIRNWLAVELVLSHNDER